MKRGEIWTASGGPDYAGKPRPVVIIQDSRFDATASMTVCALTSLEADAPLARPAVEPTEANGLRVRSRLMVDKISTVPKKRLGYRLGMLDSEDLIRLHRAIGVFLGLAG